MAEAKSFSECFKACKVMRERYSDKPWFIGVDPGYDSAYGGFYLKIKTRKKEGFVVPLTFRGFIVVRKEI